MDKIGFVDREELSLVTLLLKAAWKQSVGMLIM